MNAAAVGRFRQQDPVAFELVFAETSPAAYTLARRLCGSSTVADDVIQNAFIDVWRRAPTYDPSIASLSTWILCIVRSRSIDAMRRTEVHERRRCHDEGEIEQLAWDGGVLEAVIEGDRAQCVRAALRTLPARQRRVIQLAYVDGFSHLEIAQRLGIPLGTVKSRMRLGLRKLRPGVAPLTALGPAPERERVPA